MIQMKEIIFWSYLNYFHTLNKLYQLTERNHFII